MNFMIMGLLFFLSIASASESLKASSVDIYHIPLKSIEDQSTDLNAYRGKVLLIVNTASQCGYTPQYKGLQQLQNRYREPGLVILGFPSNDFGGQEPGSNRDIKFFCQSNYRVGFPMFSKAPVTGSGIQPLYSWLIAHSSSNKAVGWNFEKFLISRKGEVLKRFASGVEPGAAELALEVEKALKDKP